jgi:ribonuclease PH
VVITAAALAVADAGVEMIDLLTACSVVSCKS